MCYAFGIVASLDLPKSPIEWVPPQASRTYALSPCGACHYPPGETRTVRHPPGADTSAGASERPPSRAAHGPFIEAQRRPLTEEGREGATLLVGRGSNAVQASSRHTVGGKARGHDGTGIAAGQARGGATLEGLKQAYLFLRTRSLAVDALLMGQGNVRLADARRRHREQGCARWRLCRLS